MGYPLQSPAMQVATKDSPLHEHKQADPNLAQASGMLPSFSHPLPVDTKEELMLLLGVCFSAAI